VLLHAVLLGNALSHENVTAQPFAEAVFDRLLMGHLCLDLLVHPACGEVVDGNGTGSLVELSGAEILGTQHIGGTDLHTGQRLVPVLLYQTQLTQRLSSVIRGGQQIQRSVPISEVQAVIQIPGIFHRLVMGRRAEAVTAIHIVFAIAGIFETEETFMFQQMIKGADYFYVGVQINAAVFVDDVQPGIVRHKAPLFCLIGLTHIFIF
jgi:hypothetical protein